MSEQIPDVLNGIERVTVHSLIDQVRTFIDPFSRDYRSTPRERKGCQWDSLNGDDYVSGRDLDLYPGRLATFRTKWEARPEEVREAILALAFPQDGGAPEEPTLACGCTEKLVRQSAHRTGCRFAGKKANAYPWIREWGQKVMGSSDYYIRDQVERAREQNAPLDATFERSDSQGRTGVWATAGEVANPNTRLLLGLPKKEGEQA